MKVRLNLLIPFPRKEKHVLDVRKKSCTREDIFEGQRWAVKQCF